MEMQDSLDNMQKKTEGISIEFFERQEEKIRLKFKEEQDRVSQAYKQLIDQLKGHEKNFIEMMNEQMEKELALMKMKKDKIKEF